ncbi:MAG: phosphoribosyltransferase family protein, partial [Candidatus Hadarchaeum sp.]
GMSSLAEVRKRILAVDILRVLKSNYSYAQLSKLIDLPPTVLSRYINGHMLPNSEKSEKIIDIFKEKYLSEIIKAKVNEVGGAYVLTQVNYDVNLQKLIARFIIREFELTKIDKVLTAATDGIPLAVQIGNGLGAKIVVAKKERDIGGIEFLEERAIFSPVLFKTFYIPKGSIKPRDQVFIVDDIARTGATIEALVKLVERSRAKLVGIFTIFSIDGTVEKIKRKLKLRCRVESFLTLS